MHSSFFNYPITRPYPYRWFTPVVVVGGIILLVLLSVMNFVQNSYTLIVEYADNPNSTTTDGIWFRGWPSYLTSGVKPTCQATNLPINTQFFTNQSGLTWTLSGVATNQSSPGVLPSLPYLNNVFESCDVREIRMDFDGSSDRVVGIDQPAQWDIQVRAFMTCGVWGPTGYNLINLTAMYDPFQPNTVAGSSQFIARNSSDRASMYWAEALLSAWCVATHTKVTDKTWFLRSPPNKGAAVLYPNKVQNDITSLDFFEVAFNFVSPESFSTFEWHGPREPIVTYIENSDITLAPKPQIWLEVDSLAKSMYSASLTDLGQSSSPPQSNIVATAATIRDFSSNFSHINRYSILDYTQLELQDYDARQSSQNPTGSLGISPSVVSTEYLCQVPKRKPIGEIFISVLLADLVLLQAAWKLYTFLVEQILLRKRDEARACEGCISGEVSHHEEKNGTVISCASTWKPDESEDKFRKPWRKWSVFR